MKNFHNEQIVAESPGHKSRPVAPRSGFSPTIVHITLVDIPKISIELQAFYHRFSQYTHAQPCLESIIRVIKLISVSHNLYLSLAFADCWVLQPGFPFVKNKSSLKSFYVMVISP